MCGAAMWAVDMARLGSNRRPAGAVAHRRRVRGKQWWMRCCTVIGILKEPYVHSRTRMSAPASCRCRARRAARHRRGGRWCRHHHAFGRLKVTHSETGAPIPRAYVKVFYRTSEGDKGRFYKDGYTDLRGVYDYTAISTDELGKTQRFALLVVSDADGSAIKEASPPRS